MPDGVMEENGDYRSVSRFDERTRSAAESMKPATSIATKQKPRAPTAGVLGSGAWPRTQAMLRNVIPLIA